MLTGTTYGTGPVIWLAFHGIGQESSCFLPFGEHLPATHTLYSLDLPFHGPYEANDGWPPVITPTYWQTVIADFLAEKKIDRFSVVGFSMGGRFALLTAQAFASRVDELWLLAPDGITPNPWYVLATGTGAGRWLLRNLLAHTALLLGLGRALVQVRLLPVGLLRFTEATLKTPDQRQQLYRAWVGFRRLMVPMPVFVRAIQQHQVRVGVYLGAYDVVLTRSATRPLEKLLPTCRLTILPTGHTSLVRRVSELWKSRPFV